MSGLQRFNHEAAEDLLSRFLPLFAEFEERGGVESAESGLK